LIINKYPHIIITSEVKGFSSLITKAEVGLKAITVVVVLLGVTAISTEILPSDVIHWELGSV